MSKRILSGILAIILLLVIIIPAYADDSMPSMTEYFLGVDEEGMTICFPSDWIVLWRDMPEENIGLLLMGISYDDAISYFESENIYLDAKELGTDHETVLMVTEIDDLVDFNTAAPSRLKELSEEMQTVLEYLDYELESAELYTEGSNTFLKQKYVSPYEMILQYYTAHRGISVSITTHAPDQFISTEEELLLDAIAHSLNANPSGIPDAPDSASSEAEEQGGTSADINRPNTVTDETLNASSDSQIEKLVSSAAEFFENGNYQSAAIMFRQAVSLGDAEAMNYLAYMYENGLGVAQDTQQALSLYHDSADAGFALAMINLGTIYRYGWYDTEQDYQTAIEWYEKGASAGCPEGWDYLGDMYLYGELEQNYNKAGEYYTLAAENGNADSMNSLGYMYEYGLGVPQSNHLAFHYYQMAADLGQAVAMCNMGSSYEYGIGVEIDYPQAMEWYKKAVDAGFPDAATSVGWMYFKGLGVDPDFQEANRWFLLSAEAGVASGMYGLGNSYEFGHGVEINLQTAWDWYTQSAELSYPDALTKLGDFYRDGKLVDKNMEKAMEYYKLADEARNQTYTG